MADQLASPADLATLLGEDINTDLATLLVEVATGVVQAGAGKQRIVAVVDEVASLTGTTDRWLSLPQIPVTAVSRVLLDGSEINDWKKRGSRLWRRCGWNTVCGEPSEVQVTYSHGYADGAQELQLARRAVLSLASEAHASPDGATTESIDDYRVQYAAAAQGALTEPLRNALRRQYGRRGGWVSLR